jgi:hypothetical protein
MKKGKRGQGRNGVWRKASEQEGNNRELERLPQRFCEAYAGSNCVVLRDGQTRACLMPASLRNELESTNRPSQGQFV